MTQSFAAAHRYMETFMSLAELGDDYPDYRPTYDFAGEFIDSTHWKLARDLDPTTALVQLKIRRWFGSIVPGWLLAVTQGLAEAKFEFWGVYGCTALYRAQ
jgi:hypothetical protein